MIFLLKWAHILIFDCDGFTGGSHLKGTNQARRLMEAGAALTFDDMRHLPGLVAPHRAAEAGQMAVDSG